MNDMERAGAREKALALLADMDMTEALLIKKLRGKGFPEEASQDALAYVKGYGYVDDERFADRYIELRKKKDSRRKILSDLRDRKLLTQEQTEEAISRAGAWDERPLIRELAVKKAASCKKGDGKAVYRKTAAYLFRKGFASEDIYAVMDELRSDWMEIQDGPGD